jgi:hypothetical protein
MKETQQIDTVNENTEKEELPKFGVLALGAILLLIIAIGISIAGTYVYVIETKRGESYLPLDAKERQEKFYYSKAISMKKSTMSNLETPNFEYYTCEEFEGEMDSYDRPDKYTIGELYFCAQMNTWNWLKNECISLKKCPHPRNMPGWNSMDGTMQLHASIRRLFVLLLKFSEKYPNDFQWHMVGGSLLGLLRHGDIIPHDHDGDIVVKNDSQTQFLYNHIREFPDDIGIYQDEWVRKIMDVNGCLEKYVPNRYGPFIDLMVQHGREFSVEEVTPSGFVLDWNQDVLPMQKINLHGYAWPVPHNWAKYMAGDFSDGRRAYTYVPFPLNYGAHNYHDFMCTSAHYDPVHNKKFTKPHYKWQNESGILKRIDH